jgi:hypothetical protein
VRAAWEIAAQNMCRSVGCYVARTLGHKPKPP